MAVYLQDKDKGRAAWNQRSAGARAPGTPSRLWPPCSRANRQCGPCPAGPSILFHLLCSNSHYELPQAGWELAAVPRLKLRKAPHPQPRKRCQRREGRVRDRRTCWLVWAGPLGPPRGLFRPGRLQWAGERLPPLPLLPSGSWTSPPEEQLPRLPAHPQGSSSSRAPGKSSRLAERPLFSSFSVLCFTA